MCKKRFESVKEKASQLCLAGVRDELPRLVREAQERGLSHLEFLDEALSLELRGRAERAAKRRVSQACFPYLKSLEDYDLGFCGCLTGDDLRTLSEFGWVEESYNLLLLGPPGTGKTHLSIALGVSAAREGYSVQYATMAELLRLLKTEGSDAKSKTRMRRVRAAEMLIIDDVGMATAGRMETSMFFGLLAELHGCCSIVMSSNKGVDEWDQIFADPEMLVSGLDRILHKCDVRHFTGKSYRMEHRRTFLGGGGGPGPVLGRAAPPPDQSESTGGSGVDENRE